MAGESLTVVVPAYNEALRLPASLAQLRTFANVVSYPIDVLVVDDGSTDGTADTVELLAAEWPRLHVLRLDHRGKGSAVRAGMLAANGARRFLADADLSMPMEFLPAFHQELDCGAAIAIGCRESPGAVRVDEPALRHLTGRIFNWLTRLLGLTRLDDTQCGFKMFTAAAADAIFAHQRLNGFAFDVEVLRLADRLGYTVVPVPIVWRFDPSSRVRALQDSIRMFRDLLLIRLLPVKELRPNAVLRLDAPLKSPTESLP